MSSSANSSSQHAPTENTHLLSVTTDAPKDEKEEEDAHAAFLKGDVAASISFHQRKRASGYNSENHAGGASEYLKSIVYGGLDGIITTFATVTSVAGADLSPLLVLVFGIAHLVADGISMGMGDALSEQAELDLNLSEREREKWEMKNHPEGEFAEMYEIYVERYKMSHDDAVALLKILWKYEDAFLDTMMVEELGLLKPGDESPLTAGMITFLAFVAFGLVPLISYCLGVIPSLSWSADTMFYTAVFLTVLTLFVLGVVKGYLTRPANLPVVSVCVKSGLFIALNGALAALVGYLIGFALKGYIGEGLP